MKTKVEIRHVIPTVILLAFLLDLSTRFCSIDKISFTPTEALCRFRPPFCAFEPERRLSLDKCFGVLSLRVPEFRQYKKQTFTSDYLGYRNSEKITAPAVMLTGSSYSVGFGISDDETLSARLGKLLHKPVYNSAQLYLIEPRDDGILLPLFQPDAQRIIADAKKLGMTEGLVIYEYPERAGLPLYPSEAVESPVNQFKLSLARSAQNNGWADLLAHMEGWLKISPVGRWCQSFYDDACYQLKIPNQFKRFICIRKFTNGDTSLFHYSGRARVAQWRDAAPTSDYLCRMARELKQHNLRFLVLLAPTKFRVYKSFIDGADKLSYEQHPTFFAELAKDLKSKGVDSIDLTDVMVSEAGRYYPDKKYLYIEDDEHWTPLGIDVAAKIISEHLNESQTQN